MSFKREGNDSSLLSKLRKRRVHELLGEGIPEDEAKLLSNGRFTCTVCNGVPIFDTVDMLVVHRHGKKHLANLHIHESKKAELKHLIAVRKHEQFLKDGTTSIPIAKSASGGVLASSPYNPCVKRARLGPTERKPCLDLDPTRTTLATDLPGNSCSSSRWHEVATQQLAGPVIHDHRLKRLCKTSHSHHSDTTSALKPYASRESAGKREIRVKDCGFPVSIASVSAPALRGTLSSKQSVQATSKILQARPWSEATQECRSQFFAINTPPPPPPPPKKDYVNSITCTTSKAQPSKSEPYDNAMAERIRQLQGSGWKRDWDGKWIKDEDAEFDSDEEPPDIP